MSLDFGHVHTGDSYGTYVVVSGFQLVMICEILRHSQLSLRGVRVITV